MDVILHYPYESIFLTTLFILSCIYITEINYSFLKITYSQSSFYALDLFYKVTTNTELEAIEQLL